MELKTYSFPFILDDDGNEHPARLATDDDAAKVLAEGENPGSPSEHLHQLVLAEQDRFQKMGYSEALERVRKRNPKLMRLYASESAGRLRVYADGQ